MEDITQLHNTTPEKLAQSIFKGIDERLEDFKRSFQPKTADEFLTTKDLENELKISSVTRWEWGKKGILTPRKIGNRTYYLRSDVMELLNKGDK